MSMPRTVPTQTLNLSRMAAESLPNLFIVETTSPGLRMVTFRSYLAGPQVKTGMLGTARGRARKVPKLPQKGAKAAQSRPTQSHQS